MNTINETHHADLKSWVESANIPGTDFPIQNLPFANFRRLQSNESFRLGVAIGDQIVDLAALAQAHLCSGIVQEALLAASHEGLNSLMGLGRPAWSALRLALSEMLRQSYANQQPIAACLIPQARVEYAVAAKIGDYTDFYTSIEHATNVGKLFRPDNPLLPNYKWLPIGYHGRASSVVVSGKNFHRPVGQTSPPGSTSPSLSVCKRLDLELELGIFIGTGNAMGQAISLEDAENHIFGICLLNDWSARDIQVWESQPLGPFLAKSFCTSVSPWVVTLEALAPYRAALPRPVTDPQPLPYLSSEDNNSQGALDIELDILIQTQAMRDASIAPSKLAQSNYRHAYWTAAQLVTQHTVNGCNLQGGDLFGTGTLSGPTADEAGALIEITEGGKKPVILPNGETRTFLEDGDAVTLRGWCQRAGFARIGFGQCTAQVLPARVI
ncbi:fumarylacetoacetate hydrolase [Jezberella montanilacus]|jgi:fumarylacetoacetase|uniref:fumarylacetoacetase n=1 Tax=Jezberella montanilacus TaxID=323426 RepID=A0A2T0XE12_9BURK|nr:fumarylacetoacetase [Jezberella montanilacus]PRY97167.1 fumarylacetoacetate hydrolase [Jezberella montanilacus]